LPYLIIELDRSEGTHPYKYTVVGYPSRAYVWIMAREPTMDEALYKSICDRLQKDHLYDLKGMVKVEHTPPKTTCS
jgi:apolipoprotein D and lipocalin family protein